MEISEVLQTLGQYCYIAFSQLWTGIKWVWAALGDCLATLPLPTAIKLFSNDIANKCLFFGVIAFLLIMNITAFCMFARDKSSAKRREKRISEKKLMRVCFFGGAIGGIIGMNAFRHKTMKKKFSIGVPILFVLQLILDSFILGFLGFWTFF